MWGGPRAHQTTVHAPAGAPLAPASPHPGVRGRLQEYCLVCGVIARLSGEEEQGTPGMYLGCTVSGELTEEASRNRVSGRV